jgi:hypothetical protein
VKANFGMLWPFAAVLLTIGIIIYLFSSTRTLEHAFIDDCRAQGGIPVRTGGDPAWICLSPDAVVHT